VSACKISVRLYDRRPSYSSCTILPDGARFGSKQTVLRVGDSHPHPVGTMRYGHHQSSTGFLDFRKSPPVRNDRAPKMSGVKTRDKMCFFYSIYK